MKICDWYIDLINYFTENMETAIRILHDGDHLKISFNRELLKYTIEVLPKDFEEMKT